MPGREAGRRGSRRMIYCSVLVLGAPYVLLTYSLPGDLPCSVWNVGGRVLAPLGRAWRMGILAEMDVRPPEGLDVRPLLWPVDRTPLFSSGYLDVIRDLAVRQMELPGKILSRVLPAGLRDMPVFRTADGRLLEMPELTVGSGRRELGARWAAGEIFPVQRAERGERLFSLVSEPPWPVRPQAAMQLAVLRFLDVHGVSSSRTLSASLGKSASSVLNALLRKGLVREVISQFEAESAPSEVGPVLRLSAEQCAAVEEFDTLLRSPRPETGLLFGVTGSGKTAVYLELVRRCLDAGRHAMLLAPEVGIALKLHADARAGLPGREIRLYHGYLNGARRRQLFTELAEADAPRLIVGTRSCLFLPVDPGLIILDEEHDASFKQEEGFVYQAKELAYGRVARTSGLLLMGSATPDIKIFHAAREGQVHLARLDSRVGGGSLPAVELVDLRADPPSDGPFAASVSEAMLGVIAEGGQVIILHNRRGFAPVLFCDSCSESVKCPHCQVPMTLHKRRELLLCHYCGHSVPFPAPCPQCRSHLLLPLGEGTERLEEFLRDRLPRGTRVLRLDRDVSRRAGAMQEILDAFARREAQVLVGTQMLSKGHHFPGVTLVVVADGDLGLNLPDYRATERCFQMLVQVAGRAGRGDMPGRVLIQTRNPDHYCWQYILRNDYEGFYSREIALRRAMGYPPFVRLALVRLSLPMAEPEGSVLTEFSRHMRRLGQETGVRVLGPAPAPLAVLRGRKRFHCLLKGGSWSEIRGVFAGVRKALQKEKHARLSVDLDPLDMM